MGPKRISLLAFIAFSGFCVAMPSRAIDFASNLIPCPSCSKEKMLTNVGMIVKSALESGAIYTQIKQFEATDDMQDGLVEIPDDECGPACEANVIEINRNAKKSKVSNGFGMAFSGLSLAANGATIVATAVTDSWPVFAAVSVGMTVANFISTLSANGYLWDADLQHTDGIPDANVKQIKTAENKGIYPLIATGIIGLPMTCLAIYLRVVS